MNGTLATLLPAAIGTALSPIPLVELILVLFSHRRVANSLAFVATLLAGSVALLALGAAGGEAAGDSGGGPGPVVGGVFAALGALLLVVGVRNWRNRRDISEPAILARIAKIGPAGAAFLALGATFVNPKNLVLLLAAGDVVGASAGPLLAGAVFLLLATLPYTVAAGYALVGGARAEARLDRMRAWLVARNRLIMAVVCALLGAVLLAKGAAALF